MVFCFCKRKFRGCVREARKLLVNPATCASFPFLFWSGRSDVKKNRGRKALGGPVVRTTIALRLATLEALRAESKRAGVTVAEVIRLRLAEVGM